jgi:purine-binding chemotaxis protein CheW
MSSLKSYLTFSLGKHQYCIPADMVIDINRQCDFTAVPGATNAIKGILNLRGQLIVALDMSSLLGLVNGEAVPPSVSIIVDVDSTRLSLLVDKVGDILVLGPETFELPPNNFSHSSQPAIIGAHKLRDSLLIVLDPALFLQNLTGDSVSKSNQNLLTH